MGSNIGSDSGSDVEDQQPAKKNMEITEIPDSDVEDADDLPMPASASKLKGIIERINADSDDDDRLDEPIDFGEEEEEDETPPPTKLSTPENRGGEEKDKQDVEEMEVDDDAEKPQPKAAGKNKTSPSSSKSRSKKTANSSPAKTIKKPRAAAKGKAKVPKKSATATKKSTPLLKSAAKGSSPPKAQKKSPAKSATNVGSKASPKAPKKSDSKQVAQKTKSVKAKKTIDKTAKEGTEKLLLKQKDKPKTPVRTFSKKTKTNTKASSQSQSGKRRTVKSSKADSSKKQKTPKKTKAKKSAKEDEEDSGEVEVASEDEVTDASSDADDEEVACTPMSKLPIIGSLACSSRDTNAQALLDHAVRQLGKYRAVNYGPDSDVNLHAYIISAGTKRGWGILQALASGAQMVSEDWLSASISEGSWQPMSAFVSDRFGKSPRSIAGSDAHSRILEGLRIKVVCEGQDAPSVRRLVTLCGARVAETRVDVIINDTGKKFENGTNVTKKWLADSVESAVALEYQPYVVESG